MENKIPLIFGIVLLVLIPIYIFLIVPEIEKIDTPPRILRGLTFSGRPAVELA